MIRYVLLLCLTITTFSIHAWELEKDAEGIKVYTQTIEGSDFKAFRGTMTLTTRLKKLMAIMLDPESTPEWLQDCKKSELVKQVNDREFFIYYVTDAPWPVNDRDYVLHSVIEQDPETLSVLIQFDAAANTKEETDECVRVTQIVGHWKFVPLPGGKVFVEYETHADPNGDIPAWLANSFVVDQPFNTLNKLRTQSNKKMTLDTRVDFITEPTY